MAIVALSTATVRLAGWTEPKSYDAGKFKGNDGELISFDAGVSMSVCLLSGLHDFTVMKVKTAEVPKIVQALQSLKVGDSVVAHFEKNSGNYRLFDLVPAK